MEFLNIQSLLTNKLNYSEFNFKNMCYEEKEILIEHFRSKIELKNQNYERLIQSEKYLSNKYILLCIHYLIFNNIDSNNIKKIIQKVKDVYKMTNSYIIEEKKDIQEDINDETELIIENLINEGLRKLTIDIEEEDEREKIYINKISNENYNIIKDILKKSYKINYNLNDFLERFSNPLFNNKYVVNNIINNLIQEIIKDNNLNKNIKKYSIQQIVNFLNL